MESKFFLYRKPLNFSTSFIHTVSQSYRIPNLQHSKPQKKKLFLDRNIPRRQTLPFNGRYPVTEIMNLSRFISVMKFRPFVFQKTHPYLLAHRIEDRTPQEFIRTFQKKANCDCILAVYGYVRGTDLW